MVDASLVEVKTNALEEQMIGAEGDVATASKEHEIFSNFPLGLDHAGDACHFIIIIINKYGLVQSRWNGLLRPCGDQLPWTLVQEIVGCRRWPRIVLHIR